MVRLCSTITDFTGLFLFLALLVALADIGLTFWSRWKARDITPKRAAADPDKLAKLVEALTKLLLALKDLPAWFALFLAGMALAWTRIYAANLCT